MGTIKIMDGTGDTRLTWDADNDDEVTAARKTFKELTGKGYAAFSMKKNGEPSVKVTEFDPWSEKIILVPPIQGG